MKRTLTWWLICTLAFVGVMVAGCGGSGGVTSPATGLRLSPGSIVLNPGARQQFTAFLNGGSNTGNLTWRVSGGSGNGTVTTGGLYTAPANPGVYEVIASPAANPGVFGRATVTVNTTVAVTALLPSGFTRVAPGFNVPLTATVTGAGDSSVTWAVTGGSANGAVSVSGVYTAPSVAGVYDVVVTSVADPSVSKTLSVLVSPTACVRLSILNKGDIVLQMATAEAPATTANYLKLARESFYNGTFFHRYENLNPSGAQAFIIQGGDPKSATLPLDDPSMGTGGPGYTINFETTGLTHVKYALAMARSNDPNSAGSQFYICQDAANFLDPNPSLNRDGYVVFGRVIGGFSIVDGLRKGDKILLATEIP